MKAFSTGHGHKVPPGHRGETCGFLLGPFWSVSQVEILHITYAGWYFKMFLSAGQSCPLLPLVTLNLKLGGVEAGQFQVVPKASLHL